MGLDLTGRNLFEVFPATIYEGSPYVASYHRSMDEGLPAEFEAFYPEPLNIWLRVQSYPTDDGIIIFFRDFTSERADREALQNKTLEAERQHSEIEAIYRTAPIGLALFDAEDYRYLRLNDRQAAFFGLKPEQIVGRTLTEMAPIPGLKELFDQVRAGHPVINYPLEGELVTDPGEHRFWTVNYLPVYGPDGKVQDISAASLEITHQRKAELALIESEKLAVVGRLASSIAHEINNPLESVTNLIGNALDAMPSGGRLLVRQREATNWRTGEPGVSITIADNASGMSPEVQARIFNPFFTTQGVTGTGLGLWVSKEIIDRHRGSLRLRSTPNHGTVFTLFLPFDAVTR